MFRLSDTTLQCSNNNYVCIFLFVVESRVTTKSLILQSVQSSRNEYFILLENQFPPCSPSVPPPPTPTHPQPPPAHSLMKLLNNAVNLIIGYRCSLVHRFSFSCRRCGLKIHLYDYSKCMYKVSILWHFIDVQQCSTLCRHTVCIATVS